MAGMIVTLLMEAVLALLTLALSDGRDVQLAGCSLGAVMIVAGLAFLLAISGIRRPIRPTQHFRRPALKAAAAWVATPGGSGRFVVSRLASPAMQARVTRP